MKGRNLFATLVCVCASALAMWVSQSRSQEFSRASETFRPLAAGGGRNIFTLGIRDPRAASERPQKVEPRMATDDRLAATGWWPTKRSAALQDFVGTPECARCHSKKAVSQRSTPMAHASTPAANSSILQEHDRISLRLGPYFYTISSGDARSEYSVSDGVTSISEPLDWAFGLGNKGQTYVYQRGGLFYESRMSFYKTLQGLDLTTGHGSKTPQNLEDAMGRHLDPETLRRCFGCHTTASGTSAGFNPSHATPGVTCEACHGPGAKHVELMDAEETEQGRLAIFNPRRLNPVALVDFCGACHRTWADVYEMGAMGVTNVRFQPYRLENSRCWGDGDARLTCVACHDPHNQLSHDAGSYDEKCLSCHVVAPQKKTSRDHPGKACPVAKKDCVNCHMPRVVLPSMHAPFVDHRIRIVRPNNPYPD